MYLPDLGMSVLEPFRSDTCSLGVFQASHRMVILGPHLALFKFSVWAPEVTEVIKLSDQAGQMSTGGPQNSLGWAVTPCSVNPLYLPTKTQGDISYMEV